MPARSNEFQQLVFLIKKVLEPSTATVTESKLLTDRITGEKREVDVCIEGEFGDFPSVVSIECRDHGRPADVTWVEAAKAKHDRLPTTTLVLVSRLGFYNPARELAAKLGVQLLSYEQITERDVKEVLGVAGRAWAMTVALNVTKFVGILPAHEDLPAARVVFGPTHHCYNEHGTIVGNFGQLANALLRQPYVADLFNQQANESHKSFSAALPARLSSGERIRVGKIQPRIFRPLDSVEIHGTCRIARADFQLEHARLAGGVRGPIQVSWGSSMLDGNDAMLTVIQREGADPAVALHVQEPIDHKPKARAKSSRTKKPRQTARRAGTLPDK